MKVWQIYQDAHCQWRWWKLDEDGLIIQACESGFDSRKACEADAQAHGYEL